MEQDILSLYGNIINRLLAHWFPKMKSHEEHGSSVIECLTQDRGVVGLSHTGSTVLCP